MVANYVHYISSQTEKKNVELSKIAKTTLDGLHKERCLLIRKYIFRTTCSPPGVWSALLIQRLRKPVAHEWKTITSVQAVSRIAGLTLVTDSI